VRGRAILASIAVLALAVSLVALGNTPRAVATQGQPIDAGTIVSETASTCLVWATSYSCNLDSAFQGAIDKSNFNGLEGTQFSNSGGGVEGVGPTGVWGVASIAGGNGVKGEASGQSGTNGVYGHANNSDASGVYGQNDNTTGGYGVAGRSSAPALGAKVGAGVLGEDTSNGVGVWGHAVNGTGVYADSPGGYALQVNGKASFSRSGVLTISYPNKSARVTGVAVTSRSLVLATVQKYLAGVYVVAAVPVLSGSSNSFTIYLNKAPGSSSKPKSVTVGWFVVEKP
jgi:hypothetical protein